MYFSIPLIVFVLVCVCALETLLSACCEKHCSQLKPPSFTDDFPFLALKEAALSSRSLSALLEKICLCTSGSQFFFPPELENCFIEAEQLHMLIHSMHLGSNHKLF